jgi:phage terminase large subunit-like protein
MSRTPQKNSSKDPVERYARGVIDGSIVAGPWVRLAGERHLRDLENGPERGLIWNWPAAKRVFDYFSTVLRLNGGDFEGRPFELTLWQQFVVGSLFGWYTDDGYRRFRTAFCEIGKGNGKSPMAAGIGLYMLTADGEARAEVYSAAVDKDQATVLFRDAVAMVDQSPSLAKRIKKSGAGGNEWNLAYIETMSFFKPLASENTGRGKSGPRPHCNLLDEVHEHPTPAMVNFTTAGVKGRKQPLSLLISNSGVDRASVCWEYHQMSIRILEQHAENDAFFAYVCALDERDDWTDERVWMKANPNLGVSIDLKYLREEVRNAKGMPSKQSIVKRLNFCTWVDAENPWIDGDMWRACVKPIDRAQLKGRQAYGGLDLSSKNDLTVLAIVVELDDGSAVNFNYFFTPADTLKEREERDHAPYKTWVEQGHLIAVPGKSIDYAFVAYRVKELMTEFNLKELGFDRWRIDDFCRELDDVEVFYEQVSLGSKPDENNPPDLVLRPHGQGFADMAPAVDLLETAILNGEITVEFNPVMNMCSANAVLVTDPAGGRKFDKRASRGRIDGVVALAMAKRVHTLADKPAKSFWE